MVKNYKVLLIDDHPLILDSYKLILEQLSEENAEFEFTIKTAHDCDSADIQIENAARGIPFDLVFLDIRIPPSKDRKLLSGEDLGLKIKSLFKNVKIMVFTSYNNNYQLINILKTLNPDGFLVKDDVSLSTLTEAIYSVINDPPYYSKAIIRLMRRHSINDFALDFLDRKFLHLLSSGFKTKELCDELHLSRGGLVKRKKKLMDVFEVDDNMDSTLIKVAKDKGFL